MIVLPDYTLRNFMNKTAVLIFVFLFLLIFSCSNDDKSKSDNTAEIPSTDKLLLKNDAVDITIWHYYNARQKDKFDELVTLFNNTVGSKYGVFVKSISRSGNFTELEHLLSEALDRKIGADEIPNIFSAYSDTVFNLDSKGLIADLSMYLSKEEQKEYLQGFLYSSNLNNSHGIKLFPIAKATEVLILNKTAWIPFAKANNLTYKDLETWEGITKTAELYYNWTDSFTDKENDGKAFFGRDALANYMLTGAYELGSDIFEITKDKKVKYNLDKKIFRRLWNNHYIPYIKGYFTAKGKFRSDDFRTGELIACAASTSTSVYMPDYIADISGKIQDIDIEILPIPHFKKAKNKTAVQQGASMAVIKSTEEKELASVLFLKWFTDVTNNTEFAASAGYLPVKKAALHIDNFKHFFKIENQKEKCIYDTIKVSIDTVNSCNLYAQPGFNNAYNARKIISGIDTVAKQDREKVKKETDMGKTLKEAVSEFGSDEHFNKWFENVKADLDELN